MEKFNNYVCVGDAIEWSIKDEETGLMFDLKAKLVFDEDAHISDYDCYSDKQIAAWGKDEWFFGGLILGVSVNGIVLDAHAASLWRIDINASEGTGAYLNEIAKDLEYEGLKVGKEIIKKLQISNNGEIK